MPTLVTQLFLGNLRDVPILKICRLVCKSWNIEGTNSLRACSKVYVAEGSARLKYFTTLILQKALGPLQHLPSPFQNFRVESLKFTDPTFIEFAMKIRITNLKIVMDHVNARQVISILASNKTSLKNLKIRIRNPNHFELDKYNINDPIEFTCLKWLAFDDSCDSCTHILFVEGILSRCKPEYLELSMKNEDAVSCLLTQDKAENLKKLKIQVSRISKEALEHLGNLTFLGLSNLLFSVDHFVHEPGDLQQWQLFCQNVSPLLEDFETNLPISFAQELIFPNLKSIRIVDTIVWSYFTPDRFPSLEQVISQFVGPLNIKAQIEVPHRGVSTLSIMIQESVINENLEEGLSIERIPRRKSITDFVELETITFGLDFVMDPLMFRHCLPRVPKLRQINFYWNKSLSAPLLRDYLGHLERIVICNRDDERFRVAMTQVAEMVPNSFMG
ncbi:unnamed protein product [Allacma fusca]|uniref:Uncharacterized protein n=1 Tax=Allacma fusca TaxID=39272 RepID=A0A8J2Q0Z5_9HEXA|nr:unnamed protein product [Allacma fusca]